MHGRARRGATGDVGRVRQRYEVSDICATIDRPAYTSLPVQVKGANWEPESSRPGKFISD
jgi:hypothetical protein